MTHTTDADRLHYWARHIVGLEHLPRRWVRSLTRAKRAKLFKYIEYIWLVCNDNIVRKVPRPSWMPKKYIYGPSRRRP